MKYKDKYVEFFTRKTIKLDPQEVPDALVPIIEYAEFWGISDDYERDSMVTSAPSEILKDLKLVFDENEDELQQWLAGPESYRLPLTESYSAFTAMTMAAHFGGVILKQQ